MHKADVNAGEVEVLGSDEVNRLLESDLVALWMKRSMATPGFPYVVLDRPLDFLMDSRKAVRLIRRMNDSGLLLDADPIQVRMTDLLWFDAGAIAVRAPLREFARKNVRAKRLADETPTASRLGRDVLKSKAARLCHSFMSVDLRSEHFQRGDEGPYLRDLGISAAIAAQLVAWGEQNQLVCTFENSRGVSDGRHCWMPEFLSEACMKHMELFGSADLPEEYVCWTERYLADHADERDRYADRQRT